MADRDTYGRFVAGHAGYNAGPPLGTRNSPATEFKKGFTPWNAGRGEWRKCGVCGKPTWVETNRLNDGRGKFCSKPCSYRGRICKATFGKGDKHPAWIDGTARNGYTPEFSAVLKARIKERDHYTCQLCGITEADHLAKVGRVLCVNHIDFNKTNCDERNLNTLCIGCNCKVNWNRSKWTAYFQLQMEGE